MPELCPKCGSEMVPQAPRNERGELCPGVIAWVCPLDPKDCRIKSLERQLEEAKASNGTVNKAEIERLKA